MKTPILASVIVFMLIGCGRKPAAKPGPNGKSDDATIMVRELMSPGAASSAEIAGKLGAGRKELDYSYYSILAKRKDPIAVERALKDIRSEDDYLWLNAAQYLGACGKKDAVPYLIKGLKHPAWRAHDDVAGYLEALTGQGFGKDQKQWIEWWRGTNPDAGFDFEYGNLKKEALALSSDSQILINGVVDPLRISHGGPQIRLIGLKVREDVDRGKAMLLLRRAVLFQSTQLEFDSGAKLDEEGARRALVYWVGEGQESLSRFGRKGLPPVPFKKKTLVNSYLLKSGLYELDLDDVNDPRVRKLLESAMKKTTHDNGINTDG